MIKKIKFLNIFIIALLIINSVLFCVACEEEKEENSDYPVLGIWTANAYWHQNSSLNYGGNDYALTVSYDFQENNVVKSRTILKFNNTTMTDTGWIILNSTWQINGNVITLSNGKKFVIADDEFNDMWTNPQMTLHFKKNRRINEDI